MDAFTFDPAEYSRFKFGDGHIAETYGESLANGFLQHHAGELMASGKQLVILPSPYFAIPTASYAMAAAFKKTVNRFWPPTVYQ